MKLVTVATHSERYYPYLKLSAEQHGHELITLGWGEKWQGYSWKFELMKKYLRTLKDELVCFVDAFDVIVLEDAATIERKFTERIGQDWDKIIISKEQYSQPIIENILMRILQSLVFTKCKDEYINTGTYMGYSSTLLNMLENITFKSTDNDQSILQKYCVQHEHQFIIDVECNLFLVINSTFLKIKKGEYNISYVDNKLKYNNTFPSFFHGNGFTNFDIIIKQLKYDTTLYKSPEHNGFYIYWKRFLEFLPIVHTWIYVVLIVVIFIIKYIMF